MPMKIQLTLIIILLVSSFSLVAQAPSSKTIPEVAEGGELPQTPDVISGDGEEDEIEFLSADQLPKIPSTMNPQEKALFQAAHAGKLAEVQAQVKKGVSVNYADKEKRTALILAANNGHTAVVEYLYSKGADINASDKSGMTALMYAAKRSFNETAAFLLDKDADVNVRSRKRGMTALMLASIWNNKELVQMLLGKGADPAVRDKFGWTAAAYAEKRGNPEIVKVLSEAQVPKPE